MLNGMIIVALREDIFGTRIEILLNIRSRLLRLVIRQCPAGYFSLETTTFRSITWLS